jgi:hypothetical protein
MVAVSEACVAAVPKVRAAATVASGGARGGGEACTGSGTPWCAYDGEALIPPTILRASTSRTSLRQRGSSNDDLLALEHPLT